MARSEAAEVRGDVQGILSRLNATPGVIGTLLCDRHGRLAASAFPPSYQEAALQELAVELADGALGLPGGADAEMLEFRFAEGRLFVKPLPEAFLLMLCGRGGNRRLLDMSLKVAVAKLASTPLASGPADPCKTIDGGVPRTACASSEDEREVSLTVEWMKSGAHTFWEQMREVAALNRSTAVRVSDAFQTGPFRKIRLTALASGRSECLSVRVIENDREGKYDGKVILSLAAAEKLGVRKGEAILARPAIGEGIFGWEGI